MKKIVFMVFALCLLMSACTPKAKTGVWVCFREVEYGNARWDGPDPVVLGERTYDKQGRLVEAYENRFTDMGWEACRNQFTYDRKGRLASHIRYWDNDPDYYAVTYFKQVFSYDKNGNLTKENIYDVNNALTHERTYVYDDLDRVIHMETRSEILEWNISQEIDYSYSEDGTMCEELRYNTDTLTDHTQYFYDENGAISVKKERYIVIQSQNNPDWHVTEYRPDGKIARYYDLYDNGYISNESRNVYDEDGKILEHDSISSRGEINERTTYEYDESGRLLVVYHQTLLGEPKEQRRYEYLQDGDKQITNVYYASGSFNSEYSRYDEHGNLIECGNLESGRTRVYEWVFLPGVTEVEDQGMALPEYPPQWVR